MIDSWNNAVHHCLNDILSISLYIGIEPCNYPPFESSKTNTRCVTRIGIFSSFPTSARSHCRSSKRLVRLFKTTVRLPDHPTSYLKEANYRRNAFLPNQPTPASNCYLFHTWASRWNAFQSLCPLLAKPRKQSLHPEFQKTVRQYHI